MGIDNRSQICAVNDKITSSFITEFVTRREALYYIIAYKMLTF